MPGPGHAGRRFQLTCPILLIQRVRSTGGAPMRISHVLGLILGVALCATAAWADAERQPFASYDDPTLEAINQAYITGAIDESTALLYRFYFVKAPDRLPQELRRLEGEPIRCGTAILLEVYERYDSFPASVRAEIEGLRSRPSLPLSITTTHFVVHYTLTGSDACTEAYAQSVSQACEVAWTAYHVTHNWDVVPGDGGIGGGMNLTDCYIHSLGTGLLGQAERENLVPSTPEPYDYTGYLHVSNTITATGTRLCTTAHEYMHVVQFGYCGAGGYTWFMENCAMWGEETAYDQYNDYIGYLGYFFSNPYKSLQTFNGFYEYGQIVWPMYLTERHDWFLNELLYDNMQWTANIWTAFNTVLPTYGTSLYDAYMEFMHWCWYTSSRNDGNHFEEAGLWNAMLFGDWTYTTYPTGLIHPGATMRPEPLGTSIKRFMRESGSTDNLLVIDYSGNTCTMGVDFLCKESGVAVFHEYTMPLDANGDGHLEVPNWDTMEYGMTMVHVKYEQGCTGTQDYDMWVDTQMGTSDVPEMGPMVRIYPNYPNPLADYTMISYALDQAGPVEIRVIDASGRVVRNLFTGRQVVGNYQMAWDGRDDQGRPVANGVYYARLLSGDEQSVREMTVVR
jgi:hypothetical protein